jgi:hypothetical protein
VLAQVAGADDLVPEIDRPGLVPAEEEQVFAALAQGVERVLRPARGIDEADIGFFQVFDLAHLLGRTNSDGIEELDGEVRPPLEVAELLLDANHLLFGIFLGLNAAPGPPARLRVSPWNVIRQNRPDDQGPPLDSAPRLGGGGCHGRPGQPAQGHAERSGPADPLQKAPAAEPGCRLSLSAATRTASSSHWMSLGMLVHHVSPLLPRSEIMSPVPRPI